MTGIPEPLAAALGDRYRIDRELGHGGMATVYLARDLKHDRPVALKVMRPAVAATLGPDRFLREVRVAAQLQHPHIITVFDSGQVDGILWYTMPFVAGETLRARLEREGHLPIDEAKRIATEAARALEFAHQHGVLHRDIKPENLLLAADGSTLVADFGIARAESGTSSLTETGMVLGTPTYMSPEQAVGERQLDARSDIYALGCVLFEMLAGEPPFTGPTAQAILAKRLSEPVPSLHATRDLSPALERVVTRALARSPTDRYRSAAEMAEALQSSETEPRSVARGRRSRLWVAAVGTALTVAAAGVIISLMRRTTVADGSPASAAVLPFEDMSEAHDQAFFSDGLTDELITALSRIEGIRVAARTSSFQFKGKAADVREVGRRLDVGSVLEGSVRRSANRVRISAQLVSTKDGYQLWADAWDRDLSDIFAVQEEIARAIVAALRVKLGARGNGALAARPTNDVEAYDLFLKGRFAWNQRTSTGMQEAVRYLSQAVARDSSFALAWAALADAYVLVIPYAGASRDVNWPQARAAAARALALDSTLGEAHTALAYGAMIYDWDWDAADRSFQRAIAVAPGYPTGHQWYADFLWSRGRLDEALQQMLEAQRLDPLSLVIGSELGQTYYLMRRYDEADAALEEVLKLDPNFAHALYIQGLVRLQQHRPADAVDLLQRSSTLAGFSEDVAGAVAYAWAAVGDRARTREAVADLERRLSAGESGPFPLVLAHAGQGDLDRAFAFLNQVIDVRDAFLPEDFFDPLLDPLRVDPRFAAIERRMGVSSSNPP